MKIFIPPELPERISSGHKGTFGKLLVIGGSQYYIGAPAFVALAAYSTGVGLVQIAAPKTCLSNILSLCPEAIGMDMSTIESFDQYDAIVLGPGLGQTDEALDAVKSVLKAAKPLVIDADALNLIAKFNLKLEYSKSCILTPHPGEMHRLAKMWRQADFSDDETSREVVCKEATHFFKQIIVLKGSKTIVADEDKMYVNFTGDSTLAKAGTGDILSGMMGAFLAQSMSCFDAAALAVYLHGKAGELAGQKCGQRSALARDVINQIGTAIQQYETKDKEI